jgi:tetratricopeptide (TPR) repeat protein
MHKNNRAVPKRSRQQVSPTLPRKLLLASVIGLTFVGGCAGPAGGDQRRGASPSGSESTSYRSVSGNPNGGFIDKVFASRGTDFNDSRDVIAAIEKGMPRSQAVALHAIELIKQGKNAEANKIVNAALKLDISNKHLHLLNGLAYHIRYLQGESNCFDLARSGYLAAIGESGAAIEAYIQLGRLFLTAKDYAAAKQTFSEAVAIEPDNTSAIYGMAHSALFEGDTKTTLYSIERLNALKWDDPLLFRLEATVLALSGKKQEALDKYQQFEEATGDRRDGQFAKRRLNTLASFVEPPARTGARLGDQPVVLAQAAGAAETPAPNADAAKSDIKAAADSTTWFRCDSAPGIPIQEKTATNPAVTASDETLLPPVLPKPCTGESVPQAIVEVALIRTEETERQAFGVNLLEGLSGVFRTFSTRTNENGNLTFRKERSHGFAGGDDASKFLSYSLNIANSAFAKNEVIARPTLAIVDRVPAIFFSGATITLGVAGQAGGASTIVDKPVGVSLAITPTFIDDESVLLSIRATRSFIENGLSAGNSVLLQQTRNMVNATALLRYGESFVLSGLVERELDSTDSGVPVLGEIPIVQYLFKRDEKLDFRRQILTLVTVRKVVGGNPAQNAGGYKPGEVSTHKLAEKIDEFFKLQKKRPVIDELLEMLPKDNRLYRRLIDRDVLQESWSSRGRLELILEEFKGALYY